MVLRDRGGEFPPCPCKFLLVLQERRENAVAEKRFGGAKVTPVAVRTFVLDEIKDGLVMVSTQEHGFPSRQFQPQQPLNHAPRTRTAIDIVTQENETIVGEGLCRGDRRDLLQHKIQKIQAPMDVADRENAFSRPHGRIGNRRTGKKLEQTHGLTPLVDLKSRPSQAQDKMFHAELQIWKFSAGHVNSFTNSIKFWAK
jgi:hypothetical protein